MAEDHRPLDVIELGERAARELGHIDERRVYSIAGIKVTGRRRRPSGFFLSAILVAALGLTRMYLGMDHPAEPYSRLRSGRILKPLCGLRLPISRPTAVNIAINCSQSPVIV